MMQLLQQQTLQSLGGLVLGGVDTGLGQEARRIDAGLREQIPEPGIFRFESVFLETPEVGRHLPVFYQKQPTMVGARKTMPSGGR